MPGFWCLCHTSLQLLRDYANVLVHVLVKMRTIFIYGKKQKRIVAVCKQLFCGNAEFLALGQPAARPLERAQRCAGCARGLSGACLYEEVCFVFDMI
jgi:hypothetical protein